ncbi:MAG TPA: aldo/keto reductase [Armatimonadota bacterium]|nr:aldo/keto reductase [Armatimonadota bacterium]
MEYTKLGRTGVDMSKIVLGAWQFGKANWGDIKDDESVQTMFAAIDAGVNMIDTAVGYGSGYSEEIVAKTVAEAPKDCIIASKVMGNPEAILKGIDQALERMNVDCIDLYQLHYPNPGCPIADQVGAMREIQDAGKIRWIGVSNFNIEQMEQAAATARIESCQPPYNVFWRQFEDDVLPFCGANEISVIPYSPLAQGLLAGKFRAPADVPDDIRAKNKLMAPDILEKCQPTIEKLEAIGEARGKTLVETAIAWTIQVPNLTAPIIGARRKDQLEQNLGGVGWSLTEDEWNAVSAGGLEVSALLDYSSNMWGWAPG